MQQSLARQLATANKGVFTAFAIGFAIVILQLAWMGIKMGLEAYPPARGGLARQSWGISGSGIG